MPALIATQRLAALTGGGGYANVLTLRNGSGLTLRNGSYLTLMRSAQ